MIYSSQSLQIILMLVYAAVVDRWLPEQLELRKCFEELDVDSRRRWYAPLLMTK
jgi:hypothetical protein